MSCYAGLFLDEYANAVSANSADRSKRERANGTIGTIGIGMYVAPRRAGVERIAT